MHWPILGTHSFIVLHSKSVMLAIDPTWLQRFWQRYIAHDGVCTRPK
jgi:hypothetical protein